MGRVCNTWHPPKHHQRPAAGHATVDVVADIGDPLFGIGALLERFPKARAVATPAVVKFMRQQASPSSIANFWGARFPGQIPDHPVIAEELKGKVLELEGRDLVVVEVG